MTDVIEQLRASASSKADEAKTLRQSAADLRSTVNAQEAKADELDKLAAVDLADVDALVAVRAARGDALTEDQEPAETDAAVDTTFVETGAHASEG